MLVLTSGVSDPAVSAAKPADIHTHVATTTPLLNSLRWFTLNCCNRLFSRLSKHDMDGNRFAFSFQMDYADHAGVKLAVQQFPSALAYQNAAMTIHQLRDDQILVVTFEARGSVDGIAQNCVLHALRASHAAGNQFARVHPNPHARGR